MCKTRNGHIVTMIVRLAIEHQLGYLHIVLAIKFWPMTTS